MDHSLPRRARGRRAATACLVLLLLLPEVSLAGSFMDQYKDPVDGQFDTSDYLLHKHGALPVPIIITEPAVGYGGGLALAFFHRKKQLEEAADEGEETPSGPPSITVVFGLGTENGTWGAGGGHFGSWRDDHIRYKGAGGYASVNTTFYRDGVELDFNMKGGLLFQGIEFRVPDTNLFLGASYVFSTVSATHAAGPPGILPDELGQNIGGLGLVTHYDSRDNIFNPNRGQDFQVTGSIFAPGLGADTSWEQLDYRMHSYHQLHPRVVMSLRFDGISTWGDVPFYALPYIDLRGIPSLRYQGDQAGEGEVDFRVRVYKRWSLVGFVGLGWATGENASESDPGPYPAGGGGIRYLLARRMGMQVGIDVARGPEQTAFYIQVGGAW